MEIIKNRVLSKIAGFRLPYWVFPTKPTASRVVFFYKLYFKQLPIIILRYPLEKRIGDQYTNVIYAARFFDEEYGFSVIVDGIPQHQDSNLREHEIFIKPMTREQIESIPELFSLISFLKENSIDNAVWNILGGWISEYMRLQKQYSKFVKEKYTTQAIIDCLREDLKFLLSQILYQKLVRESSSNTKQIIKIFQDKNLSKLSISELRNKYNLNIDMPNDVFQCNGRVIEPKNAAIALLLKHIPFESYDYYRSGHFCNEINDIIDNLF
jgi:hypothetical protein